MTVPASAYELRFNFPLSRITTAEDIAIFGLWLEMKDGSTPSDANLIDYATAGYDAWKNNISGASWTTNVQLGSVDAITYNLNGSTKARETHVAGTPWVGTSTSPALPWETALAVSLYTYPRGTFVTNGKRKRGRFYLPPMSANNLDASNSGFFQNATIGALLAEMADFLAMVNRDGLGVAISTLSVFSRTDSILRPVTQLSVDAKFDSQRRRQNREQAGHIEVPFA